MLILGAVRCVSKETNTAQPTQSRTRAKTNNWFQNEGTKKGDRAEALSPKILTTYTFFHATLKAIIAWLNRLTSSLVMIFLAS